MKKMAIVTFVLGISTLHLLRFQSQAEDQSVNPPTEVRVSVEAAEKVESTANSAAPGEASKPVPINRTEAVVDVRYLIYSLQEFQHEQKKLAAYVKEQEELLQAEKLRAREENKNPSPTDPKMVELDAKRKRFCADAHKKASDMFLAIHGKLTAEVTLYANENGIRFVRNLHLPSSHAVKTLIEVSPSSADSVFREVSPLANSVFTVTSGASGNFSQKSSPVTGIVLATGETFFPLGKSPVFGTQAGVTFSTIKKVASGNEASLIVNQGSQDVVNRLMEKEVIYAASGDEFDITPEILKRLNAKYEQATAGEKQK